MNPLVYSGDHLVVPGSAPADLAVAANYERFDGLEPLDHPATSRQGEGARLGASYGDRVPRPGQLDQPQDQVYTPGPLFGVTSVIGGQPLPTSDRLHRPPGTSSFFKPVPPQRPGVGQGYQGVAQTSQLAALTNNPPVPDDLSSIIGGWG